MGGDSKYGWGLLLFIVGLGVTYLVVPPPYEKQLQQYCATLFGSKKYDVIGEEFYCIDTNGVYQDVEHTFEKSLKNKKY